MSLNVSNRSIPLWLLLLGVPKGPKALKICQISIPFWLLLLGVPERLKALKILHRSIPLWLLLLGVPEGPKALKILHRSIPLWLLLLGVPGGPKPLKIRQTSIPLWLLLLGVPEDPKALKIRQTSILLWLLLLKYLKVQRVWTYIAYGITSPRATSKYKGFKCKPQIYPLGINSSVDTWRLKSLNVSWKHLTNWKILFIMQLQPDGMTSSVLWGFRMKF